MAHSAARVFLVFVLRSFMCLLNAYARVAELVDALDLGSSGVTRGGSSPPLRMFCVFYGRDEREEMSEKR